MKRNILITVLLLVVVFVTKAQVTRLSNNTSYDWGFALTNTKILLRSGITKTIWAYDIPGNTFTQLSSTVTVEQDYDFGIMNSKLYFAGKTTGEGIELWVTDGTPGGTSLVKDIKTGAADSRPSSGFIVYNNALYFTADDGVSGRELWKTDGTTGGTVQVKDINTGAAGAFPDSLSFNFAVINGVLVFSAFRTSDGDELWKTDGSDPGTTQLKDIYATAPYGSLISSFTEYNGNLIFAAYDETNDHALWKTDGTPGGTALIKDIDPSPVFSIPGFPPFHIPSILPFFFNFQNELFFSANDPTTTGLELWKTDGTTAGTVLVKDINTGIDDGNPQVFLAVKNSTKFYFTATSAAEGTELWQSDGTGPGTTILKDIETGPGGSDPFILPNFNGSLFQGSKFFFTATGTDGSEYYISDGTPSGTTILKDINPGPANGFDGTLSWFYTNDKFFFVANDGINGTEPWQSDGTGSGTTLIADVNPTAGAASDTRFTTIASGTLFFFATDGDNATLTDFFKLDATVSLPLLWTSVEARPSGSDILVLWKTAAEDLTNHFIIQRSDNGSVYYDIGKVNARGSGANSYQFTDANAMKAGVKKWYYRIKYVDADSKSAFSRIVTLALNKTIASVQVAPVPADKELRLIVESVKNDNAIIRVIDAGGRTVSQNMVGIIKGRNIIKSDASHLTNGTYFVQIIINGSVTTERFLIQK